jgi:CarboxypepD_reg-like domain/TonB-dependent Receptor Plug Domain
MSLSKIFITSLLLLASCIAFSQKKSAFVSGKVVDENENPLSNVSIVILGQSKGITTNDSGYFRIKVTAEKAFAIIFSYTGRKPEQKNFLLNENEEETVTIRLEKGDNVLQEVIITDQRDRREAGLIRPNPKTIINLPSAITGVESLIKIFVGSNNELTSQYSVRGGSYDENLIYVNDFEIFRPYLVRSGQQEGLSFINPEMVRNINFYNGGFQAKYGDKMSSVLDIQYKKPKHFGGSAYVGILEQGLQFEGINKNSRFSYLLGVRNRSNRNLLSRQDTKGNYVPSSADFQALLSYQFNKKWSAELLSNISQTKFTLIPESSLLTTSIFSPIFTASLGVRIDFEGREKDAYQTNMLGFSLINQVSKKLKLKWMASRFENDETENLDIIGSYLFGERDFDKSSATFGEIVNPLGAGIYQNWARNSLNIENWNLSHKGNYDQGKHSFQWGVGYDKTKINDKLDEWEFQDSAGYALPYTPNMLQLSKVIKSSANLDINKFSGYIQDNILLGKDSAHSATLTAGVRFNYNSLNKEFLISPRIGASWKPNWKKPARLGHSGGDIIFRIAAGAYHQPPFYRELRRYNGTINTNLQSQKSWQGVLGFDYNFKGIGGRAMRWTTEAYYKNMTDVVPYDIDNVRIRYFGENNAKAYAAGIEMRLHGELVEDAESWISLGIMKTSEDISGDNYSRYKNAAGEFITARSTDQVVKDSVNFTVGWLRRPTDRRVTFGMYFSDYLPTNKNFKMYLNLLYGTNMPYNIPNAVRYRNAAVIEPYIRADIGFSALLVDDDRSKRRSHSPFRNFDNIWASLEVFNIIDRANTISYLFIKDFSNTTYLLPNRLTPRLLNFKIVARW